MKLLILKHSKIDDTSFSKFILNNRMSLTDIRIMKCDNITDKGIEMMTCLVTNLQALHVEACPHITKFSQTVVATNCKQTKYTFHAYRT